MPQTGCDNVSKQRMRFGVIIIFSCGDGMSIKRFHTLDRVPNPEAHHLTFGPFKINLDINCF